MRHDVKLIAFDTSAAHCAAALLLGDQVFARVDPMTKGQAEHLMPLLNDLLSAHGIDWPVLDGIGVGTGPGNFTGIRIGVSAARGLALGLNRPAIGVDGFEARAFGIDRPVKIEIPAPRAQAYVQHFGIGGPETQPKVLEKKILSQDMTPDQLVSNIAHIAANRLDRNGPRPVPVYVRDADAAPPRDPAPTILS